MVHLGYISSCGYISWKGHTETHAHRQRIVHSTFNRGNIGDRDQEVDSLGVVNDFVL